MKNKKLDYKYFFATNKVPPQWFLDPSDYAINSGDSTRAKMQELKNLDAIAFAWVDEKNEFIPLDVRNKDCKIQDYRFILKYSSKE